MRVLVTGSHGKVGSAAVAALQDAGHEVTATDLARPVFEAELPGEAPYVQADLTDAGDAYAVVRGHDAVVHAAALPDPAHNPPHVVFHNNLMSVFNVLEAAVRLGLDRVVNVSSETVPGFLFAERADVPDYVPVDEEHPVRAQDPYALAKTFGEQLCDAAVRRSDLRVVTVRPSWVTWEGNAERNLGPVVRDLAAATPAYNAYVDVYDLAELLRLAVECDLPGHEVVYGAQLDTIGGHPLAEVARARGAEGVEVRPHERPDASGIDTSKARRLLRWEPRRTWRDYLDEEGRLRDDVTVPARPTRPGG